MISGLPLSAAMCKGVAPPALTSTRAPACTKMQTLARIFIRPIVQGVLDGISLSMVHCFLSVLNLERRIPIMKTIMQIKVINLLPNSFLMLFRIKLDTIYYGSGSRVITIYPQLFIADKFNTRFCYVNPRVTSSIHA